jgi:hypothetical protein
MHACKIRANIRYLARIRPSQHLHVLTCMDPPDAHTVGPTSTCNTVCITRSGKRSTEIRAHKRFPPKLIFALPCMASIPVVFVFVASNRSHDPRTTPYGPTWSEGVSVIWSSSTSPRELYKAAPEHVISLTHSRSARWLVAPLGLGYS